MEIDKILVGLPNRSVFLTYIIHLIQSPFILTVVKNVGTFYNKLSKHRQYISAETNNLKFPYLYFPVTNMYGLKYNSFDALQFYSNNERG